MYDAPEISVILTTHNRAGLLARALAGFARQTLAQTRFEIVAVDDGSSDQTPLVLERYRDQLPLRVFCQAASGLAAAKNLGVFASRAPIIVFADDDDVPDPDYLVAHLAAHLRHRDINVAVLARSELDPAIAVSPLMRHVTGPKGQLFSHDWMAPGQILSFREFWGGRSSCKRALLTEVGVFNPAFRFGCEDIELAWRLQVARGIAVVFEPQARTRMIRAVSFDEFCMRSIRQGRSQWLFAQLHDHPLIRAYCEIDQALGAWRRYWSDFTAILRWARRLDEMMQERQSVDRPILPETYAELDAAYRFAFQLCRAKGVVDAGSLPPILRRPESFDPGRMSFLAIHQAPVPLSA
jgi:glycosyltransferase involved in cell wall biosynthesis